MKVKLRTKPGFGDCYAREGEKLYCENGHHIATMRMDGVWGDHQRPEHFKDMKIALGSMSCPDCSGKIVGGFGGQYWFEDKE